MRIQHNIMAMSAYRNYTNNVSAMKKNLEKLSSGYKINRAGDDAAGLAISEKMRAQITGLETAQKNAKDGISLVQTAEGALTEVHDMLNRMVELATQSANGTYDNDTDRAQLQKELEQLRSEINRIADSSNFNGIKLLDGSMSKSGAASALERFELPALSTGSVGTGTIKHVNAADATHGTTFSVDLHNVELSNASGATYTLKAGDLEITFSGTAAASAATNVSADALRTLLTGGSVAGFQIDSITVAGSDVTANFASGTITGTKFGDIKIIKDSGGDDRLTFQQVNPPTANQVWAGAREISITKGDASGDPLNMDGLINLHSDIEGYNSTTPAAAALGAKAVLTAAKASATGTIKAAATAGDLITNVSAAITGSNAKIAELAKAAGASATGAVSLKILSGGTKAQLIVGTKAVATAALGAIATNATKTIAFGSAVTVVLTNADTSNAIASSAWSADKTVALGVTVHQTPATEATITAGAGSVSGTAAIKDYFNGASAASGDIVLKATASTGSATWTLKVGSKTMAVTFASGVVKDSASNTLFTIGSAGNKAAVQKAAAGTSGIKVGTFTAASTQSSASAAASAISKATTASAVVAILEAASMAAVGSAVASIASGAAPAIATVDWAATAAATVATTAFAAAGSISLTIGSTTVHFDIKSIASSVASSGKVKMGELRQAILDKLQSEANKITAAQVAASATTVTVYSDFEFVDDNGTGIANQAANQAGNIRYNKTQYSRQQPPVNTPTNGPAGRDYNFTATNIEKVEADSGKRLASTYITKDKLAKVVKDGGKIMLGGKDNVYTFSADPKNQGANIVDISDLVDDDGNLSDANLDVALERLTKVAAGNSVYTVGYDNGKLGLTEIEDQTAFTENGKSTLDNMKTISESVGFYGPATKGNGGLTLQIGDTADPYNKLTVDIKDMHTWSMGKVDEDGNPVVGKSINDISILNQEDAAAAVDVIKAAINYVSDIRGTLGATQNRLDHTINNLSVMTENIQDAESTIRDTDVADEMMAYTKNNILIQSAQAMLAQANQVPQGVLQLLQ